MPSFRPTRNPSLRGGVSTHSFPLLTASDSAKLFAHRSSDPPRFDVASGSRASYREWTRRRCDLDAHFDHVREPMALAADSRGQSAGCDASAATMKYNATPPRSAKDHGLPERSRRSEEVRAVRPVPLGRRGGALLRGLRRDDAVHDADSPSATALTSGRCSTTRGLASNAFSGTLAEIPGSHSTNHTYSPTRSDPSEGLRRVSRAIRRAIHFASFGMKRAPAGAVSSPDR